MPGLGLTQERSQLSTPASAQMQILNELKIQSLLLMEIIKLLDGNVTDNLTDLRDDAQLLSE